MEAVKYSVFFVSTVYLILGLPPVVGLLPPARLTAPYGVNWRVNQDYVEVNWKHKLGNEPSHGYYISVQRVLQGMKLGAPNFVHVNSGTRTVTIRGLQPGTYYEMKVG